MRVGFGHLLSRALVVAVVLHLVSPGFAADSADLLDQPAPERAALFSAA